MVTDEGFFGEFTSSLPNQTVHSNPSPLINAPTSPSSVAVDDDDDDDWGDFVNSGALSHTLSLPKLSKSVDHEKVMKNNGLSEPNQPGSAPSRVNSGSVHWEKPKGALPLSIFGLEEEEQQEEKEEKSGASTTSLDNNSNNNVKSNVNDLSADLYINNHIEKENDHKKIEPATEMNGKNKVEPNVDWDPLNLNSNRKENSIPNERLDNIDDHNAAAAAADEGWEFKDAQQISEAQNNEIKGADWNMSNLDFNGWNSNVNGVVSSANSLIKDPVDGNRELHNDDDDGWEFMGADSKPHVIDNGGHVKTEQIPVLNSNGTNSSWDAFFPHSNGLNSDDESFNGELIDEKKHSGDADGWAFSGKEPKPEPELQIKTENRLSQNSEWNSSSLNGSANTNLNGLHLDTKQVNLNFFDENEDLGDNDGWEFKTAEAASWHTDKNTKDDGRMPENLKESTNTFCFDNDVQVPGDFFGASQGTSSKLGRSDFEFDFSSMDKSDQNVTENGFHFSLNDGKVSLDENSWAFEDVFSEIGSKDKEGARVPEVPAGFSAADASAFDNTVQENMVKVDNHKGALPLSIFGDEENETDDSLIYEDISTQTPTFNPGDGSKRPHLDMSINDLISNLYSQAKQNESINHAQSWSEDGLDFTKTATTSNLENANHDLDDDSWEFQDAFTGAEAENQTSVHGLGESHTKYSTKGELHDYVEFFSNLREKLHHVTLCHLENLKDARSAAAFAGEDAKVQALDTEMQDLKNNLHQDGIFSCEVHSENHLQGDVSLNAFIEILQEPKFQDFDSEYQLTEKVLLVESDLNSALELLNFVSSVVQILTSVSKEGQSDYTSAWFKMLSVCAQELRHGAFVWKQSILVNVHAEILSRPQGKNYVLALGEIYRVVEVLGSSARLYKPWILASSTDQMYIFTLLSECSSLWSSSGLEEALESILNSADFEDDGNFMTLPESIQYIRDLDAHTLYNHVFSRGGPTCQLSALTTETVPGMKTVVWNEEHCFLTLANLWGTLVSNDPPKLPCLHIG